MLKRKIFFDIDNTICNSAKRFVEIYNEIYNQQADWAKCDKWDFSDICPLVTNSEEIFARHDFYNNKLEFTDEYIPAIIHHLYFIEMFDIHFVTIGTKDNLQYKKQWLKNFFNYIPEENYHLLEKTNMGKGEVDMLGSILIDDNYINLLTSNAELKICMHKRTGWNKDIERSGFIRVGNSMQLYKYIKELEYLQMFGR